MKLSLVKGVFVMLVALVLAIIAVSPVFAHQEKEVGDYRLEVGFAVEPAFQNQMNGVEFIAETREGKKVEGLEKTVQFEISAGGKTRTLSVHPVFDDPGHYVGEFMPTLAGDYVFHLTGTIDGTAVDETFESGPGRFSPVSPLADAQFPDLLPQPGDVAARIAAAESRASQAQTLGVIGLLAGVLGLAAGGLSLVRRRP